MAKVLVIEDSRSMQRLLHDILEASGFQTLCASNGRIGLEIAQQWHPDLILSDVNMPEMDGYAVLEALRQNLNTATIPIVFLTAEPDVIFQLQSKQLNVNDCLSKSVNPAELVNVIQQLTKQIADKNQVTSIKQSEIDLCPL